MPPDPLDADWLRAEVLRPGSRWQTCSVVPETGSTNADLAAGFRGGEVHDGTVLVSDFQSAGRGRQGRTWTAPPGSGIAMSVLIEPDAPEARWTWLPLIAGLAVADALRAVGDVAAALKWPNDVLVGEEKICGVLAERVAGPSGIGCVLGMGINVHLRRDELPVPTATSLALLRPELSHVRNELIATTLALMDLWLGRWESAVPETRSPTTHPTQLHSAYVKRSSTLGRRVEVHTGAGRLVTGLAEAIDEDGRLVVATDGGREHFAAGDVTHLR